MKAIEKIKTFANTLERRFFLVFQYLGFRWLILVMLLAAVTQSLISVAAIVALLMICWEVGEDIEGKKENENA